MKVSIKGLALACGCFWGGSILLVGTINLFWPVYGVAFLDVSRSVYPGYANSTGLVALIFGTMYGLVDGMVIGAIIAWLYNTFSPAHQGTTV